MPDYQDYNARKAGRYGEIWTQTGKCVFCDLKEKYIIAKNASAVLTVNLFPYIDGSLIVIPIKHVEAFVNISPEVWSDMRDLIELGIKLLQKELKIDNIWLNHKTSRGLTAGKSVSHGHMLLIPYKEGLFSWNYQDITISPLNLAEKLRNSKLIK